MAKLICIMGESGSGKTTAMRNLDPATTFYIDADKKGLNWKGWRAQFSAENSNYLPTDSPSTIMKYLAAIGLDEGYFAKNNLPCLIKPENRERLAGIKTVVIDTLNGIMVAHEMRTLKVQGYGKWTDLAQYVWDILDYCLTMRSDLSVIVTAHTITESDENGIVSTHIRTNGRKLEKIVLESKMNTVLWAARGSDGSFILRTDADNSTTKAPMGAFTEKEIPNDVTLVLKALEEY